MSEGMYGQPQQELACGCVGACTCFSQPYHDGNHWYTQGSDGHQYLWTGSGWVNASSAEAQSVLAADTPGVSQQYTDPASGVVYQPGGYWYAQGSDGYQYAWTTSGWLPAAPAVGDTTGSTTGYTELQAENSQSSNDYAFTTPQPWVDPSPGAVVGPPTVGASTSAMQQDSFEAAMLASGDPMAMELLRELDRFEEIEGPRVWLDTMRDQPDFDRDKVSDVNDYEPLDSDVQDPGDFDPDPDM